VQNNSALLVLSKREKYLVAVVVPVDQWKIAGSYIESIGSTMGARVDAVLAKAVLQKTTGEKHALAPNAVETVRSVFNS